MTLGLVGAYALPVSAVDNTAAISQGFAVEGDIASGAIVSFADPSKSGTVQSANIENADRIVGVASSKPLIELSGDTKQTQVVISGTVYALVSNINGDIRYGDRIAASPLSGIGMKATASGQVLGAAAQDFSTAQEVREHKVRDRGGKERTVQVGLLPVQVNVSYYQAPEDEKTFLPPFLQNLANSVAGRQVGAVRLLIAIVLLLAGFGGIAVLAYSSVRSSIISIGRNPLSAPAVNRSLIEVGVMSIGVLLVMLIAVYLVLVI